MPCTLPYWKSLLLGLDQLGNCLLAGWPDETLSSRCYRWRKSGRRKWPEKTVNALFFWDRDKETGKRHCEMSFESEAFMRQLPPEARAKTYAAILEKLEKDKGGENAG